MKTPALDQPAVAAPSKQWLAAQQQRLRANGTNASAPASFEAPVVVSAAQWLEARRELLAEEKEFSRRYDALSALQRALPWTKVEKD